VDASVVKADANRARGVPGEEVTDWHKGDGPICSGPNSANGRMRIAPPTPLIRISMPPNFSTAYAIAARAPS